MDGMSCLKKLCCTHFRLLRLSCDNNVQRRTVCRVTVLCQRSRREQSNDKEIVEEEFRTYTIPGLKPRTDIKRVQRKRREVPPPRYKQMPTDQDWTNVWPTAASFKWSVIPFPVRQGFVETITENEGVIPSKYANAELMKIPNFLHLTPAHVKKQCAALKEFCTEWPAGLETDELCQKHFPVEVQTSDYVFSGPSIRDPRARAVTVKLRLSDLELDYHARDKFKRLVGKIYNPDTDEIVFTSDRCPLKMQNYDYIRYLLTAVYFESWKKEAWEDDKAEEDMEKFFWEKSKSKDTALKLLQTIKQIDETSASPEDQKLQYLPEDTSEDSLLSLKEVQDYRDAVSDLMNQGESHTSLLKYGQAVRALLGIKGGLPEGAAS